MQLSVLIGAAIAERNTICLPPLTEIMSRDWLDTCRAYEWLARGVDRLREHGKDVDALIVKKT